MKTHRPLLGVVICFAAGIALSNLRAISFGLSCILTVLLFLLSFLFINKKIASTLLISLSFVMLGITYTNAHQKISKDNIYKVAKYYRGRPTQVEGVIISDVQTKDFFKTKKTTFTLRIKKLKTKWGWRKKSGRVLVNVFREEKLSYGDYIRLEGKIYEPFDFTEEDTFSYKEYLKRRKIYLMASVKKEGYLEIIGTSHGNPVKASALYVRSFLKKILNDNLSVNEAGIVSAIILGDRTAVPKHIKELFIQTGTAHILAVSGLHVGIVAFLIFLVFKIMPINRKVACMLTILFLVFYAFMTGGRPSVIRATIMASILIAGFIVERETDIINSLSLAALVILSVNPMTIFDVGFQLSFVSVLSIISIYPRIEKRAKRLKACKESRAVSFVIKSLTVSIAAWAGVAGLIVYYFGIITPVTVFANLVIIPCVSIIITIGFSLMFFGIFCGWCAFIIAYCLKAVLSFTVGCIYICNQIPGAHFYLDNVSLWHILAYYFLLILLLGLGSLLKLTKFLKYVRVNPMKRLLILISIFLFSTTNAHAFWMWTPETNKWVNPKYSVKDTPKEQLEYALESYEQKDYKKAIHELEKLIKNYPRAREAADAQYYLGVILEEQGELYRAFKAYQKVIEKYPFSERSGEIVSRQYRIGEGLLDGQDKRNKIIGAIIGNDYDIVDVFKTVIKNAPYGPLAPPSQYKIGLYLQEKGLHQEARDEFEKVINDYPDSEWVKAAKYQIALVDSKRSSDAPYDQRVTQAAKEEFEEFVEEFPEAQLSENAKKQISELREKEAENAFLAARFYEKHKNYKAAKIYYDSVVKDYPETSFAEKALKKSREVEQKKMK